MGLLRPDTRRSLAGLLVIVMTTAMLGAVSLANAAQAANTLVTCPIGTQTVTFQPGLTFVPQSTTIHVNGTLGPCASASNPAINNAAFSVNGSGLGSCLTSDFDTTMVVNWNDGPNSVIRFFLTVNLKPGGETVYVSFGEVESGQFAGAQVVRANTTLTLDVAKCLTTGVETASGPSTLTLIG